MHSPAHPGDLLKHEIIAPLQLTIEGTAEHLGVSRKHLSRVCNGKAAISPELAVKLEQAFGAPSAETWLKMQAQYDISQIMANDPNPIQPIAA